MSFDLTTHKRNGKGQIAQENHYIRKVSQGTVMYERPPKSGVWFYEDGSLVHPAKSTEAKADEIVAEASAVTDKAEAGQRGFFNSKSK